MIVIPHQLWLGRIYSYISAVQDGSLVRITAQFKAQTGAYTDAIGITVRYKDAIKGGDSA